MTRRAATWMTGFAGRRRVETSICRQPSVALRSKLVRAAAVACGSGEKTEGMVAPMSVMKRVSMIFRAKANKALDRMEDPRETLDYSYQTQLELLQKVRRGVADVATSRKRVELQMNQLQQSSDKLDRQARDALAVGREDLARDALTRKAGVQSQLNDLNTQYQSLQGEEEKLTGASQRLQAKVDAFRTKKETIKATYTAAEAQTRINEAFTGISEEMGDVGLAIQRAEDKTEQMKARAGAIDELMASGRAGRHGRRAARRHPGRAGPDGRRSRRRCRAGAAEGRARPGQRAAADRGRRERRADGGTAPRAEPARRLRRSRPARPGRLARRQPISRRQVTGHDRPDPGRGPAAGRRLGRERAERARRQAGGDGRAQRRGRRSPRRWPSCWPGSARSGSPVEPGALEPSELILPGEGATMADVRKLLAGDGLIPG